MIIIKIKYSKGGIPTSEIHKDAESKTPDEAILAWGTQIEEIKSWKTCRIAEGIFTNQFGINCATFIAWVE